MEKSTKNIVCITGKLNSFVSKAEAKEHLESLGYEVRSTVTKDVTILLNESGVESGKTKKARDNGVRIVTSIDELEETLNHNKSKDSNSFDKKAVISTVTLNGEALKDGSEELKADKEVVMAAVKQYGRALEYASKELKDDKQVVMAALKNNGYSLQYASEELKADKEVVMAAVKRSGALEYASKELKDDKQVVMVALKNNGYSLQYASEELKDDKQVVMVALKLMGYGESLQYASMRLKGDKEVVMAAVKQQGSSLKYTSEELRDDKELVMVAVKQVGQSSIEEHRLVLMYASSELKDDAQVVLAALLYSSFVDMYETFRITNHHSPYKLFKAAFGKKSVSSFEYASKRLKGDKEFFKTAITKGRKDSISAFEYASSEIQEDKDIRRLVGLENITSDKSMTLSDKSMTLKEHIQALLKDYQHYQEIDPNVINELIFTEDLISYLGKKNKNNKLLLIEILEEVDTNMGLWDSGLSYPEWAYNDKDIALLLIGSAQVLLSDFSAKLRADREVVMAALETDPEEIESVSKALQKDKDIIALMNEYD